jgi:hypothetical protein
MHASIDRMGLRDLAEYFHLNDDIYGQSPTGFKDYLTAFFYRPFLEWAFASLLGYDLRLFQAFQQPPKDRQAVFEKVGTDFEKKYWSIGSWGSLMWKGYYSMLTKSDECVANCRIADSAIQAGLFHMKNKRWPSALGELKDSSHSGEFLDPFNPGSDLKVIPKDGGIIIYSVGYSGIDHQGRPNGKGEDVYYSTDLRWVLK